jgi:hypothetical protein
MCAMRDIAIVSAVLLVLLGGALWWMGSAMSRTSDELRAIETDAELAEYRAVAARLDAAGIDLDTYNRMAQAVQEAQR